VLYKENLIRFTPITGQVQGMATEGAKADICSPEVITPIPWARVAVSGGPTGYADGTGSFSIPYSETAPVNVDSFMDGTYFTVHNWAGTEETLSATVTPGEPYTFVHNADNTDDLVRSQVNCYVSANYVRDWVLLQNPSYPGICTETGFPIYVNRTDGYCPCNAWSDGVSINFCQAGDGCPNTGWQNVLDHEYGHHVIDYSGSGQGPYGEGTSDCIAVLTVDDPNLGYGFFGDCDAGLRTADNDCQYSATGCSSCGGEAHDCGNLLSGCVWSVRNELIVTEPEDYLSILSRLAVNSILLHSASSITSQIATDFLALDDDDSFYFNGTPHCGEICSGFAAHGMYCPALGRGLSVQPQGGLVSTGERHGPFEPSQITFTLKNLDSTPIDYAAGSTQSWLTVSPTSGTISQPAEVVVSINSTAADLPVGVYHDTVTFTNTTDHVGDTVRLVELTVAIRRFTLETSPGWIAEGEWAFGLAQGYGGTPGYPDPDTVEARINVYGVNLDGSYPTTPGGPYYLTTDEIDLSGTVNQELRFKRWLNTDHWPYAQSTVELSVNGAEWIGLWSDGGIAIADHEWTTQTYDLSGVVATGTSIRVRWGYQIYPGAKAYSGWNIDDIEFLGDAAGE
jgi:hypothetical protein